MDFITGYAASAWNLTGKTVVHVTNLNASGPGSFADAVSGSNRIILFDVGGQCNITSTFTVSQSNLVICTFTAPGLYGYVMKGPSGLRVTGSNVAWVGPKIWVDSFGADVDAIQLSRANNVLMAYGSALFGTDECLSTFAGSTTSSIASENLTWFSMLAVPANNNHHGAGGMMNGKGVNNVDYIQSVAAFPQLRGFRFAGAVSGVQQRGNQYNCVTYNWLNQAYEQSGTPDANCIGNFFKRGPRNGSKAGIHNEGGRCYIANNNDNSTTGSSGWTQVTTPFSTPYTYEFLTFQQAYDKLITDGGVGWKNSPLELAVINHIKNGTMPAAAGANDGIESISQLGGWPTVPTATTEHIYGDIGDYLASFFGATPPPPPPPPTNQPPTFEPIEDQQATIKLNGEVVTKDVTLVYDDPEGDSLTVEAFSDNQSMVEDNDLVINGNVLEIWSVPTQEGTARITVSVSDGVNTSVQGFNITFTKEVAGPPAQMKKIDIVTGGYYELYYQGSLIDNSINIANTIEALWNHMVDNPEAAFSDYEIKPPTITVKEG